MTEKKPLEPCGKCELCIMTETLKVSNEVHAAAEDAAKSCAPSEYVIRDQFVHGLNALIQGYFRDNAEILSKHYVAVVIGNTPTQTANYIVGGECEPNRSFAAAIASVATDYGNELTPALRTEAIARSKAIELLQTQAPSDAN